MKTKSFALRFLPLMVAAICAGGAGAALAQLAPGVLPTGGTVVGGQASIVQNGTTLNIHQTSSQALVNFSTFNVGSAALVDIRQPGAAAALLARVTGSDPSQIHGQIKANGSLWLINPAGIMVGQGARIDVGGFIASTLNVSDTDFLAGRLTFTSAGNAGVVSNAGAINAASGGRIYLVGQKVENTGTLHAPNGEVLLAAGQNVQLVDTGHPGVSITLSSVNGDVKNMGRIVAEAGRIGLAAGLVTNAGDISASSAVSEGGRVFLRATDLETTSTSDIHANGTSGGKVVLLADKAANIDGRVSATGSAGPGGFVDTSGHQSLNVKHAPTVGKGGQWLIDPSNLEVVAGAGGGATVEDGVIVSTETGTTIGADVITAQLNTGASVALVTGNEGAGGGNIVVNAAIAKTAGGDAQLTLRAHNDIEINAPITSRAGALGLSLKNNFYGNTTDAGHAATLNANLDLNGGVLEVSQGEALGNGTLNIAGGTTTLNGASSINAAAVNVQQGARVSIGSTQNLVGAWANAGEIELRDDGAIIADNPGASLVNNGRITLSGSNAFALGGAADMPNLANNGDIVKTSGGAQQITALVNGQTGRILVDAGRLTLDRTTVGGQVGVAEGAALILDGSKLAGRVDITGAGAMTWAGGVQLLGDVTLGANAPSLDNDPSRVTVVSGPGHTLTTHNRVNIAGTLVLDGDMTWDNHGTIRVGPVQQGTLAFNTNAILNNKAGGVVDVKDGSYLALSIQTTIDNEAGALLQVASTNTNSFSGGYQGRLINSGTVVKTGAGTTPATLTNLAGGVLKINEGGFGVTFSEDNANAGRVDIASGATLRSTVDLHNAGLIRGTGTVELGGPDGARLFNDGTVAPGGADDVGMLAIHGGYIQGPRGALDIRLAGARADVLSVDGAVQLAGTLNLSTFGGGMPTHGVVADFLVGNRLSATGAFTQVNAPAVVTPETTGTLSVVYPATGTAVAQVTAATVSTTPLVVPPVEAPVSDVCLIAPDSMLCRVLPPSTLPEPVKPVVQASSTMITSLLANIAPTAITASEIAESVSKGSPNSASSTSPGGSGTQSASGKKAYCN